MLDFSGVISQIEDMVKLNQAKVKDSKQKLKTADNTLSDLEGRFSEVVRRVQESKTSWLVADPLEEVNSTANLPSEFKDYTVLASDGSQLFPDHHETVLCYMINIGTVVLKYGSNSAAQLTSQPELYYKEDDLYIEENGVKCLIDTQRVSNLRTQKEAAALVELAIKHKADDPIVALTDGTLIHWAVEQQSKRAEDFLGEILTGYEYLRQSNIPIAGYISGTRSADVINMLRVQLCPQQRVDCDHCLYSDSQNLPCEAVAGLRDAALFNGRLKYGQRSAVFKSRSSVLNKYGAHWICFFYVNVGQEIARVEVPLWVAENPTMLNTVHSVVVNQAEKGQGYPVCLSEAHVQAVISGADRQLFYQLVERKMVESGLTSETTYKSLRKRSVPV